MKIKQQRQINAFLVNLFGKSRGDMLFRQQEELLDTLIRNTENKTKDQMKTLTQTILPRIALYKVLNQSGLSQEDVYSNIFLRVVRRTNLWDSEQAHGKDYFDVTMKKCLWHTACLENGCEKLCPLFCDVDNVTYGGLKKLDFSRTKTLGYGGDCCDFHFFRKRS